MNELNRFVVSNVKDILKKRKDEQESQSLVAERYAAYVLAVINTLKHGESSMQDAYIQLTFRNVYESKGGVPQYIEFDTLLDIAVNTFDNVDTNLDYRMITGCVRANMSTFIKSFDFDAMQMLYGVEYEINTIEGKYYFMQKKPNLGLYLKYKLGLHDFMTMFMFMLIPVIGTALFFIFLFFVCKFYWIGVFDNAD